MFSPAQPNKPKYIFDLFNINQPVNFFGIFKRLTIKPIPKIIFIKTPVKMLSILVIGPDQMMSGMTVNGAKQKLIW
jgi:hypothetical protein